MLTATAPAPKTGSEAGPRNADNLGSEPAWDDTLEPYLDASNEDEVVCRAFRRELLVSLQHGRSPRIWFEVGPGPGTKTRRCAEILRDVSPTIHSAALVDSSDHWVSHLSSCGAVRSVQESLAAPVILLHDTFGAVGRRLKAHADVTAAPSIVTAIHVLYEPESIHQFRSFVDDLAAWAKGQPVTYFVVSESPNSDFARLRQSLRQCGFSTPQYDSKAVSRVLRAAGAEAFREVTLDAKYCYVDADSLDEWLAPFLLGCGRNDFEALSLSYRQKVITTIRRLLDNRPDGLLRIPDSVCVGTISR